jgi:hypothetical protein
MSGDRIEELTARLPVELRATMKGLALTLARNQIDKCRRNGLPLETIGVVFLIAAEVVKAEIKRQERERRT